MIFLNRNKIFGDCKHSLTKYLYAYPCNMLKLNCSFVGCLAFAHVQIPDSTYVGNGYLCKSWEDISKRSKLEWRNENGIHQKMRELCILKPSISNKVDSVLYLGYHNLEQWFIWLVFKLRTQSRNQTTVDTQIEQKISKLG